MLLLWLWLDCFLFDEVFAEFIFLSREIWLEFWFKLWLIEWLWLCPTLVEIGGFDEKKLERLFWLLDELLFWEQAPYFLSNYY